MFVLNLTIYVFVCFFSLAGDPRKSEPKSLVLKSKGQLIKLILKGGTYVQKYHCLNHYPIMNLYINFTNDILAGVVLRNFDNFNGQIMFNNYFTNGVELTIVSF